MDKSFASFNPPYLFTNSIGIQKSYLFYPDAAYIVTYFLIIHLYPNWIYCIKIR